MAFNESIESVSKASEAQAKPESQGGAEEQFQNVMDSSHSSIQTSFERVDVSNLGIQHVEPAETENNPILTNESATSQKSGSATDEENKRQQSQSEEGIEEISEAEGVSSKTQVSSITEAESVSSSQTGSIEDINKEITGVKNQIQEAKQLLSQPNSGEIKSSYQKLLRNHLTHADDNLKIASSKVGLEYNPTVPKADGQNNPAKRFLQMLTSSEAQMNNISHELTSMSQNKEFSLASSMLIQHKMHMVSQQLELFTNLLNKALEGTKTLLNVQV